MSHPFRIQRKRTKRKKIDGVELVRRERSTHPKRGYDAAHDDATLHCDLSRAAACYAIPPGHRMFDADGLPVGWPWIPELFHPRDRKRELVKAGALIAAAIDVILREEERCRPSKRRAKS